MNGEVPSLFHKRLVVPGSRDVINGLEEAPPEKDNDNKVTDAVRLVLEKDPFMRAEQIHVTTLHSVVTLEGLVPTEETRTMAEIDAWYVFGVDKVVNNLMVQV